MIALAKFAGLEVLHASTNYDPHAAPVEWYGSCLQRDMPFKRVFCLIKTYYEDCLMVLQKCSAEGNLWDD